MQALKSLRLSQELLDTFDNVTLNSYVRGKAGKQLVRVRTTEKK